ncbi:MAG: hypothetical protein AAGA48_24190 [Myxococcota bacterium]
MRWISFEPDAWGVIAIGQTARGVIAVGQWAYGAIAIGQFAFGGVAVGALAMGGVTLGLSSFGLYLAGGLIGGGAHARGPCVVPLLPSLGRPKRVPVPERLAKLRETRREGWIAIHLEPLDDRLLIYEGTTRLTDLRLDARIRRAARTAAPADVLGFVRHTDDGPILDRIQVLAKERLGSPRWWLIWMAQLVGLFGLALAVWTFAVEPLFSALPLE